MFVIPLLDGEEVHAAEGDKLTISDQTDVLTVLRVDGFEEVTTHYSPSAWASVTHRVKEHVVRPSLIGTKKFKGRSATAEQSDNPIQLISGRRRPAFPAFSQCAGASARHTKRRHRV